MGDPRFEEEIVTKREITGPVKDLILFLHVLIDKGAIKTNLSDADIVSAAKSFYEAQHGED